MSKAPGFRQSQSVLHTWSGLVVGWVLYLIFLTGTASYWKEEITRWMQPEVGIPGLPEQGLGAAVGFLSTHAQGADRWAIELPDARAAGTRVTWLPEGAKPARRGQSNPYQATLDAHGVPVEPRQTRGGNFFYRLHFDLHYIPVLWARWFVCFCAMFMLVAIVSGVITHKKIFADFFTFRRTKGQRTWLDGHNALAVLSLPFHLMITYTGLITLMTLYMPWGVKANFDDRDQFFEALQPRAVAALRLGQQASLPDLAAIVKTAEARWDKGHAGSITIEHPGDAGMRLTVRRRSGDLISDRADPVEFNAAGQVTDSQDPPSAAVLTRDGMIGLHAARFAPLALRWLFFLSGVAGTLMVVTGLVLWTVKRRQQLPDPSHPHLGFRLVEKLNVGFLAGLPIAMTGYLWANRLLPTSYAGRADAEVTVFFALCAVCLGHAFMRRSRQAWCEQLFAAGVMLIGLPLYNLILPPHALIHAIAVGDGALAGMDAGMLALGGSVLWAARKVRRFAPAPRRIPRMQTQAPATEPRA
ncbi:Uncharacterized iron-regulated membrane protein [Pseudoxanthomonas sp. GM95]|uniref:PepSY-associated TM helix domain-containing protein n=1 Tax=Pseudoxanthomonas sp. GM95 TaxID=1881043 RepID=UPI0008AD2850|nr:PepSY-associated TM helix domain-containing protein [Pseudoxanthomonas sp. GM95]SEL12340.1 Uncharacterized iron-regulated membrane protein [Pseudoxanthomonas sp. GM95]